VHVNSQERSKIMKRNTLAAEIIIAIAGGVIAGVVFTAGSMTPARHHPVPRRTVASQHAMPSLASQAQAWLAGPGGSNLRAVSSDLQAMQADISSAGYGSLESDAGQLNVDAVNAMNGAAPPAGAGQYRSAMSHFANAGALMEHAMVARRNGDMQAAITDVAAAGQELQYGTAGLAKATAAIQASSGS
jgi:hypothetical protein